MRDAIYCEHANEVPCYCPCDADCYCKEHTCKNRKQNIESCNPTKNRPLTGIVLDGGAGHPSPQLHSFDLEYVLGFLDEYQDSFEHYVMQHTKAPADVVCERVKNTLLNIIIKDVIMKDITLL